MFGKLELTPSKEKLQDFAKGMAIVSVMISVISLFFIKDLSGDHKVQLLVFGAILGLLFLLARKFLPQILKPLFIVWVGISVLIGMVIGPIVLSFAYFLVITPVGILSSLTGKKWLDTKDSDSHWVKLSPYKKEDFKQQF